MSVVDMAMSSFHGRSTTQDMEATNTATSAIIGCGGDRE